MYKFWKSIKQNQEPEPNKPESSSVFSTHQDDALIEHRPKRAVHVLAGLMEKLEVSLPVAKSESAMDDSDSGFSQIKKAFSLSQPNIPDVLLSWYASQGFIGHQMAAILAQHWLINKACTMPARDCIRQGYEITAADGEDIQPDVLNAIRKINRRMNLDANMLEFVRKGRIFGIRVAFFKVDSNDPDYYEKPFNIDGIAEGSYKGIVQVDPYWCAPMLDQASSAHPETQYFYEPTWWMINGKRYHRTHLVIFRNAEVPDILKPSYLYGGVPVPQQIAERVYAAERTANEGPMLAMSKRTTVFSTDIAAAYANKDKFDERMAEWIAYRDNQQIKIADKEGDSVQQFDTSLADLDSVIMTQYQIVAAAANVPATKLLGTTPKGFNSTGEYEESAYHEELESIQTHDLTPFMERHYALVMRSFITHKFNVDIDVHVSWNPLDSPTALEYAQINSQNATSAAALIQSGAIDAYDERSRLINDKNSGYSGLEEIGRPEFEAAQQAEMEAQLQQQMQFESQQEQEKESQSMDSSHWITVENGEHVLVDGDGQVISGAGGNMNYSYLPNVHSKSKDVHKTESSGLSKEKSQPNEQKLVDHGLLSQHPFKSDIWRYKTNIDEKNWLTANSKEDAIEEASKYFDKTPESEKLTIAQKNENADKERDKLIQRNYGYLTDQEINEKLMKLEHDSSHVGEKKINEYGTMKSAYKKQELAGIGEEKLALKHLQKLRENNNNLTNNVESNTLKPDVNESNQSTEGKKMIELNDEQKALMYKNRSVLLAVPNLLSDDEVFQLKSLIDNTNDKYGKKAVNREIEKREFHKANNIDVPELTGVSQKQIDFGKDKRDEFIKKIKNIRFAFENGDAQRLIDDADDEFDPGNTDFKKNGISELKSYIDKKASENLKNTSAKYWIETKFFTGSNAMQWALGELSK